MSVKGTLLAGVGLLLVLALTATSPTAHADPRSSTYEVTLENLTDGQPFSPPVAATHRKAIRMFRVGKLSSTELEAIAENGDPIPMFDLFNGSDKVTQAVNIGRPLTTSGKVVGGFTDSVSFEITARPGDRFSLATMLICTNDGFTGLDSVRLPKHGSHTFFLNGYDGGTENNTEESQDIVDPCSGLGPVPLPGDPNGNQDAPVATAPAQVIQHHPGILDVGDLDSAAHGWTNPVAKVTIERID